MGMQASGTQNSGPAIMWITQTNISTKGRSVSVASVADVPFVLMFVWVIHMIAGPLFWVPLACIPILVIVGGLAQIPLSRYVK